MKISFVLTIFLGLFLVLLQGSCNGRGTANETTSFVDYKDPKPQLDDEKPLSFKVDHPYSNAELPFIFSLPPSVQKRLEPFRSSVPGVASLLQTQTSPFELRQPSFTIRGSDSTMIFNVIVVTPVSSSEYKEESINLMGSYDPNSPHWRTDLYATDEKIKNERRVQAVAECKEIQKTFDDNQSQIKICLGLKIDFFYKIDGRIYRRVMDSENSQPKVARSGDSPEDKDPVGRKVDSEDEENKDNNLFSSQPRGNRVDEFLKEEAIEIELPTEGREPLVPAPSPYQIEGLSDFLESEASARQERLQPAPHSQPAPIENSQGSSFSEDLTRQAIYSHVKGRLEKGVNLLGLPELNFRRGNELSWGTSRMKAFLQHGAQTLIKMIGQSLPLQIGDIAKREGGQIAHKSHQTGLDADFYPLKGLTSSSLGFDVEINWKMIKALTLNHPDWVIVFFVGPAMKKAFCQYAENHESDELKNTDSVAYKALHYMVPDTGHKTHIHVRLFCPPTQDCINRLVLPAPGLGCHK